METFANVWYLIMIGLSGLSLLASLGILFYYLIKRASLSDPKDKYDLISQKEVKTFNYSIFAFALAVFFALNTFQNENLLLNIGWLFIRLGVVICMSTLVAYVPFLLLKYSYPKRLNRKLRHLRYATRKSPEGNKMRLLGEEEEDVHLDEGMIAEENIFSVDYDVWLDEMTGYTKIEKYPGHLVALECDRCGMQTLKIEREEILEPPTESSPGELVKHYKCSYCNRIKHKPVKIAKLGEYKLPDHIQFFEELKNRVQGVKIEILSKDSPIENFEFQTLAQAKKFLDEYDKKE